MDETILFPSPNWFLPTVIAISNDGWLAYGSPSKGLCVLEPLSPEYNTVVRGTQGYHAHVLNRAHQEKIVSVDISPEWSTDKSFITGSLDGTAKQWIMEPIKKSYRIKSTQTYNIQEEVVGVGYSNEVYAVIVGAFGNTVKWDLKSNVVKSYHLLKTFKPVSMACSQHALLNVAVGTKQGVIFVLDLNDTGKIIYKVRGHDEDIVALSWCPQYEVLVKKSLAEPEQRSSLSQRLDKIRQHTSKYESAAVTEKANQSGLDKTLPDDSFDDTVVIPEDDMFDIYKDHAADEFGHKKYQPEDIVVKVKEEKDDANNFLAECMKVKEEILKRKNEGEPSIESLVAALDNTHVDSAEGKVGEDKTQNEESAQEEQLENDVNSDHTHKHLLASIGKHGGVRIWSKSGKLVASCAVPSNSAKFGRYKNPNWATLAWYSPEILLIGDGKSQLLECNPLKIDSKNKVSWKVLHTLHKRGLFCIATNAPRVQTSTTVKEDWQVWTAAQDRNMIHYSVKKGSVVAQHATCGGFVYCVQACPYDARKIAVSVGDGAVRVWEAEACDEDDGMVLLGHTAMHWQNVQGKVLTAAWHPTKENLLAFATAESRVGLIEGAGRSERGARVLGAAGRGGVYSLCWQAAALLASSGGRLCQYPLSGEGSEPVPIPLVLEGQSLEVSSVASGPGAVCVGSAGGAVCVLRPQSWEILAAVHVFTKMIHTIDWHPQQPSHSSTESPHKNLLAVCSLDKSANIVILEYGDKEDGGKQLTTFRTLSGHKLPVLTVAWNPHIEATLLSTSSDATVRVWDALSGACTAIFPCHAQASLGAAWSPRPARARAVLSGGADCALRLWHAGDFPPEDYEEIKPPSKSANAKKKQRQEKKKSEEEAEAEIAEEDGVKVAASLDNVTKPSKKYLMPITYKQMAKRSLNAPKKMFKKYLERKAKDEKDRGDITETEDDKSTGNTKEIKDMTEGVDKESDNKSEKLNGESEKETEHVDENSEDLDLDFLKLFGTINDVNELLDMELEQHLQIGNHESWMMLSLFRGRVDDTVQFAVKRDALCPFIVSMAPCVSLKYWKDVTQLYLAQIDRLVAKREDEKLAENKYYGGAIYRKTITQLSVHDVKGAINTLVEAKLFKEAYALCRIRYMDSIAEEVLQKWARFCFVTGLSSMAATCFIALDDLTQAAAVLGKSNDQDNLSFAAELAKANGQVTFADHMEEKMQTISNFARDTKTEEILEELPSRIELLIKEKEITCD